MSATDVTPARERGRFAELLAALGRSRTFLIGAAILLFWIFCALFGEHFTPYDPLADDIINSLMPPSAEHWFGTCLLYTSPSPRDRQKSRMPSSA